LALDPGLVLPHPEAPEPGRLVPVAPGIHWLRLPLPFRLDHVNVYLIEDGPGFALLDTGIDDAATRALWDALFDGPLRARPLTRVIATHYHPDHAGLAGWLCERTGVPLLMSRTEYLTTRNIGLEPGALDAEPYRSFYLRHGLDAEVTDKLLTGGHRYLRMVSALPRTFQALGAGETLTVGAHRFDVLTGGGHAPDQVMLHAPEAGVLLAADQVLARISPNVSVQAVEPEGDPLGRYLASLASLRASIPADALVLPGHDLPFVGLHRRIDALAAHHAGRCETILRACAEAPRAAAEIVPILFPRPLDPHGMGFAFSEALAHVNRLVAEGRLVREGEGEGWRYRAS
jgi:glyoxylase-like metal-dependent hydrolase (beta-lactamase superfamily II)